MKHTTLTFWLLLVGLSVGFSSSATAATVVHETMFEPTQSSPTRYYCNGSTDVGQHTRCTAEYNRTRDMFTPRFDTDLGELTGIGFQAFLERNISAILDCTVACPHATSSANIQLNLFLESPTVFGDEVAFLSMSGSQSKRILCPERCLHDYDFDLSAGRIVGTDLEAFGGSGPGVLRFRVAAEDIASGSTGLQPAPVNGGSLLFRTTYIYTPIPEPGTATLLCVGLIAMTRAKRLG